jgi:nucleoside-diphosphate-sugar epimerase
VVVLRPFNTFGPRQSARAVIPTIISQLASSGSLTLGSLDPVRDFLYVKDTARGFMAAAEAGKQAEGEVINVGTGESVTIGETAAMIGELMGVETGIELHAERIRPAKSEVMELVCNADKAARLMNWSSQISFKNGLQETIDYIGANLHRYKPEVYNV